MTQSGRIRAERIDRDLSVYLAWAELGTTQECHVGTAWEQIFLVFVSSTPIENECGSTIAMANPSTKKGLNNIRLERRRGSVFQGL